jgi:hypothetical protein
LDCFAERAEPPNAARQFLTHFTDDGSLRHFVWQGAAARQKVTVPREDGGDRRAVRGEYNDLGDPAVRVRNV